MNTFRLESDKSCVNSRIFFLSETTVLEVSQIQRWCMDYLALPGRSCKNSNFCFPTTHNLAIRTPNPMKFGQNFLRGWQLFHSNMQVSSAKLVIPVMFGKRRVWRKIKNPYTLVAVTSSGILKAKQKLGVTFNSIDFTKFSKLTMCSAQEEAQTLNFLKISHVQAALISKKIEN